MINNSFYEELASMVEYHRKKSGLNRIELASLAGVGKTVIYDLEHAKPTVRLSSVIKILNVLNIKIQLTSSLVRNGNIWEKQKFFNKGIYVGTLTELDEKKVRFWI